MIVTKFDPNKPHPYATYARMSSDRQNKRSPIQQRETIAYTLKGLGYPWRLVAEYEDIAISGRYMSKRAGFQRMLREIRTGELEIDFILCDTVERFGRMDELESIQRGLRNDFGVYLLTADTSFADPTGETGRAIQLCQNFRATGEGRTKAHNVFRGKRDAVKLGHWPGGPAPAGLRLKSIMMPGNGPLKVAYSVLEHDPLKGPWIREIHRLAAELGWGACRIAKCLNRQPEFVALFGRIDASTVDRMLANAIYIGVMVWPRVVTDVINDRRVVQRVAKEDQIRVEDYCEPLISLEVWNTVQAMRRKRSEAIRNARQHRKDASTKLIAPLTAGMILKHALTGLVRCGVCGASMRPNTSGRKSAGGKEYTYYRCPGYLSGGCSNAVSIREDWLRRSVIAVLRQRLFPPPTTEPGTDPHQAGVPEWLTELMDEVEREWRRLPREDKNQRSLLAQESGDLRQKVNGWTGSLSKPQLSDQVRVLLEQELERALARIAEIERGLAVLDSKDAQLARSLDPQLVLENLHRLDKVLESANPTMVNAELSMHIDRIDAYPDYRVVMRTCRLGVFEGAEALLSCPDGVEGDVTPSDSASTESCTPKVRPRRRAKLRVEPSFSDDARPGPAACDVQDPDRFAGLRPNWFWEDTFELPRKQCWSAKHAREVKQKRDQTGWTQTKLTDHFGVSRPTIRRAIELAEQEEAA